MGRLRRFVGQNRGIPFLFVVMTLATKAMLPAGYMLSDEAHVITVRICGESNLQTLIKQGTITVTTKGVERSDNGHKAGEPCPYSVLAMTAFGGTPALLIEIALAFVLARAFESRQFPVRKASRRLRPPLRRPPLMA